MKNRIMIIGLGLMGGSLGYALKKNYHSVFIKGIDISDSVVNAAISLNAIDKGYTEIKEEIFNDIELVIIATPISLICPIIEKIIPFLNENTIITDVGSTKYEIVKFAEKIIKRSQKRIYFIGAHPMTGSEFNGIMAMEPTLYENIIYILTKTNNTNEKSFKSLKKLLEGIGSIVTELNSEDHDIIVSYVSHLPMIVASSLVDTVSKESKKMENITSFVAGGFKDITRIASSDPVIWKDIFLTNKDKVVDSINNFIKILQKASYNIKNNNKEELFDLLLNSKNMRNEIPRKNKGILAEKFEIIITVPDKPGMIGDVAYHLGKNKVNIRDIEVLKVREGEAGSIRIAVSSEKKIKEALNILNELGYTAMKRK